MSDWIYTAGALALVGAVFCGLYAFDRQRLWWAIIPGLGAFTFVAALISNAYVGTDSENDWLNVLVVAVGTTIIAGILKRADAKLVLYIVAAMTLIAGISMAPLSAALKAVFIALVAVGAAIIAWGSTGHGKTLKPS